MAVAYSFLQADISIYYYPLLLPVASVNGANFPAGRRARKVSKIGIADDVLLFWRYFAELRDNATRQVNLNVAE